LRNLSKAGRGAKASWLLGTYDGSALSLDVRLLLDKNPNELCCILAFVPRCALGSAEPDMRRCGYMPLTAGESSSALRGVCVAAPLRGQGLSKLLLAIWLRLCVDASVQPCTREINKPLLSWSLMRLGFAPARRSFPVPLPARTLTPPSANLAEAEPRATTPQSSAAKRTSYVRTLFLPPEDLSSLSDAVDTALAGGRVRFAEGATVLDIARALTLR
jgi:hypothetical protein